jgi:nudix-type nucleoside diphosphatase (YffH/AdpP family)
MPSYLNGNSSGMMIEVCAGMLDKDHPEACIIKEAEEETGFKIAHPKKVFELFSTPGAVTEKIHYFIAEYSDDMKISDGGGLEDEHEEIEVLEINFETALIMVSKGEINDAKTVVLLQYAKLNNLV